ncbi:carbon-nitrogen hydrolase [Mycena alexandri]|uniref:Carbon-nitrogen hydrolase n=1 Tax=Mycena alexandri TaxID=1745969 RepID=A0AAD6SPC1_9AGAR|nr:carbon-nitrogen hydrolase [Mycena alexandri]
MKVAAIQAEPAWWDLKAGVAKSISLIKEAASNGAELIGFPESFIPGYPMAIWAQPFDPVFLAKFQKNCLSVQSPEFKEILAAVKEAGIWVVLGFAELDGGSMYAAQVIINSEGVVVLHRRKLKSTGQERTIWGDAPADSLQTAVKGPGGATIGALSCWEHLQPLLRFHHYSLGVQVHVASWPYCDSIADGAPARFSSDAQSLQCKFVALEGQMFVISSTQILSPKNAELCCMPGTSPWAMAHGGGFAAIYSPDGTQLTEPTAPDQEVILYADIDIDATRIAKLTTDPVGHYSRPDLLSLRVNTRTNSLVSYGPDGKQDHTLLGRVTE